MTQGIELASHPGPTLVSLSDFGPQWTIAGESVEYLEMCFRIEKGLLIALPVNIDEVRTQIAQQQLRGELIVDEDLVASAVGELATNDQLVSRTQACIFEDGFEIRV